MYWGPSYFAKRYFPGRYWASPVAGGSPPPVAVTVNPFFMWVI